MPSFAAGDATIAKTGLLCQLSVLHSSLTEPFALYMHLCASTQYIEHLVYNVIPDDVDDMTSVIFSQPCFCCMLIVCPSFPLFPYSTTSLQPRTCSACPHQTCNSKLCKQSCQSAAIVEAVLQLSTVHYAAKHSHSHSRKAAKVIHHNGTATTLAFSCCCCCAYGSGC